MNVLIADDSDFIRQSLSKLLSMNTSIERIFTAGTVQQSISIIKNHQPDIIVLDISFPEGSGFDVLIKAKQVLEGCKVIMLTNYPTETYKNRALREGADYFFDKSNEFDKVIEVINNMIDYEHKLSY